MTLMRVAYVAASLDPVWGGPVAAVQALARELQKLGVDITVYAPRGVRVGSAAIQLDEARTFPTGCLASLWTGYSPSLAHTLNIEMQRFDIVHIHELWHHPHVAAYKAAIRWGRPFIVSPHGELGPWHMKHKAIKKSAYMRLVQRRILGRAAALHALTEQEKADIHRYVPDAMVRVIPNGVDASRYVNLPPRSALETRFPTLKGKSIILFLGRLHRSKGVHTLASAFATATRHRTDLALVLAGSDEEGLKPRLERFFRKMGLGERVVFTGLLAGDNKFEAFGAADLFVLPSYAEGFSTTVLEAMASGIPVVISEACRFPKVAVHEAGIVVPTGDADALARAIVQVLVDDQARREMGARGRRLVWRCYTWASVAAAMFDLYTFVSEQIPEQQVHHRGHQPFPKATWKDTKTAVE